MFWMSGPGELLVSGDGDQGGSMRDPTTTKKILAGWRRLIASMLKTAVQDARNGDQSAAAWLRTDGIELLGLLGIKQPAIGVERLLDPPGRLVISIFKR